MNQEMDKKTINKKVAILGLAISFTEIICGILALYAFYNDSSMITVFGTIVLALTVVQIIMGHQIVLPLLACVIGAIAVTPVFTGICVGICYEAVFAGIFAYIIVLITKIKGPLPQPPQMESKDEENETKED